MVYFRKDSVWLQGFVISSDDHTVVISRYKDGSGAHLRVAFEDIVHAPESPLLADLDIVQFALGSSRREEPQKTVRVLEVTSKKEGTIRRRRKLPDAFALGDSRSALRGG